MLSDGTRRSCGAGTSGAARSCRRRSRTQHIAQSQLWPRECRRSLSSRRTSMVCTSAPEAETCCIFMGNSRDRTARGAISRGHLPRNLRLRHREGRESTHLCARNAGVGSDLGWFGSARVFPSRSGSPRQKQPAGARCSFASARLPWSPRGLADERRSGRYLWAVTQTASPDLAMHVDSYGNLPAQYWPRVYDAATNVEVGNSMVAGAGFEPATFGL
jgi:hypothetical protein